MKDYSHLKGKEVTVILRSGEFNCFVADIDFSKGITLKDIETEKDKVCLNKEECKDGAYKYVYADDFEYTAKQIERGLLDSRVDPFTDGACGGGMNCAF